MHTDTLTEDPVGTSNNFTDRQIQTIRAWAKYHSVSDAAHELGISVHTLQTHLKRMRKKVGVSRTFDVYQYLLKQGLL